MTQLKKNDSLLFADTPPKIEEKRKKKRKTKDQNKKKVYKDSIPQKKA